MQNSKILGSNHLPSFNYEYQINNIFCDRDFLTNEEHDENNKLSNNTVKCPEITVKINNATVPILLDTGSTISCISEQWFKDNIPLLKPFEELPLSNTVIRTATGNTSRRVGSIIHVPITIEKQEVYVQLLVVPNLIRPVIFGMDVLAFMRTDINFGVNTITMNLNDYHITLKFDEIYKDGRICFITTDECLRRNDNDNINDNNIYDDFYDNIYNEELHDDNCNIDCLLEEAVAENLRENDYISEQQRETLINLIMQYQETFSDKPGLCNKYTHELNVNNPQTFKSITYPVPIAHQESVLQEINRMERLGIIEWSKTTKLIVMT